MRRKAEHTTVTTTHEDVQKLGFTDASKMLSATVTLLSKAADDGSLLEAAGL